MSLVICANQNDQLGAKNEPTGNQDANSWRNGLSSILTIPKNSQVAMQSIKYQLNDTVDLDPNNPPVFYQHFGRNVQPGIDSGLQEDSTSFPLRTPIRSDDTGLTSLSREAFALATKNAINDNICHPNYVNLCDCTVKTAATTPYDFEGYNFIWSEQANPAGGFATEAMDIGDINIVGDAINGYVDNDISPFFSYDAARGEMVTLDPEAAGAEDTYPLGIAAGQFGPNPISLNGGTVTFNLAEMNASGFDWAVGLSRVNYEYVDNSNDTPVPAPLWYDTNSPVIGDASISQGRFFYDYLVSRNGNNLEVHHTPINSSDPYEGYFGDSEWHLREQPFAYANTNASSDFTATYDIATNASNFQEVKFTCNGEQIKIELLEDGGTNASVLYQYDAAATGLKFGNLKPINQCMWNMFPIVYMTTPDNASSIPQVGKKVVIKDYVACSNVANPYDWRTKMPSDWSNESQSDNNWAWCKWRETSNEWNDYNSALTNTLTGGYVSAVNGSAVDYGMQMITKPISNVDSNWYGIGLADANAADLLGFSVSPWNTVVRDPLQTITMISQTEPEDEASRAMFLRLSNFTQLTTNAMKDNKSNIISHIPRTATNNGNLVFYEPNERVYIDLNNPNELNINSFDLSLVTIDERLSGVVGGTTVVCLHFKSKM